MATSRLSKLLLMAMALDISVMCCIAPLGLGLHHPRAVPVSHATTERRTTDTGRSPAGRATPADLAEVTERLRTMGALKFDSSTPNAKADFINKGNVQAKKRGSCVAERLCMRYLTKGFSCGDTNCKQPHVPNLNTLPESDRKKMIEFVSKMPGLSCPPEGCQLVRLELWLSSTFLLSPFKFY